MCLIRVKTVGRAKNAVATRYRICDYICTKRRGRRENYLCVLQGKSEEKKRGTVEIIRECNAMPSMDA